MESLRLVVLLALPIVLIQSSAALAEEKPKEEAMKAKLVHYSGQVQGVGFRAAAAKIARDYPVTGWVKNLADGRVEMLVEGTEENIKKFRQAVRERWKDNINKEQDEDKPATGRFKSFEVVK
jgi:acylphosphatase